MPSDVALQPLHILFVILPPHLVEPVTEAIAAIRRFFVQDQTVGDVDQLPLVVVRFQKRYKRLVGNGIERRNVIQICRDMVILRGLVKCVRQYEIMDFPVKRRRVLSHNRHRLQPACAGGLEVEVSM